MTPRIAAPWPEIVRYRLFRRRRDQRTDGTIFRRDRLPSTVIRAIRFRDAVRIIRSITSDKSTSSSAKPAHVSVFTRTTRAERQ